MSYNNYSEEDVKYQFITPSIENAGWDKTQIRFEYSFTDGQMIIRGRKAKRGARKRADYLLSYKPNLPLAVVEAKIKNMLLVTVCSKEYIMLKFWMFLLFTVPMVVDFRTRYDKWKRKRTLFK